MDDGDLRFEFSICDDDENAVVVDGFEESRLSSLREPFDLTIPSEIRGRKVVAIADRAFYDCDFLKTVEIPASVKSIGDCAFECCSSLSSVALAEGLESIGVCAFSCCSSLTSVAIPASVRTIEFGAFAFCGSLRSIDVSPSSRSFKFESGALLSKSGKRLIAYVAGRSDARFAIPPSVRRIDERAFAGAKSLVAITFSSEIKDICDETFRHCASLESIELPESVGWIGALAFADCCSLKSIALPNRLKHIGSYAFSGCSSLSSIALPDRATQIDAAAFVCCDALCSFEVSSRNRAFKAEDGVLFSKDGRRLIAYPGGRPDERYVFPNDVCVVEEGAFAGSRSLVAVEMSENLSKLGYRAFFACPSLTSAPIPARVEKIGPLAFGACSSLTSIEVSSLNGAYKTTNGVLFSQDGRRLIAYPNGNRDERFVIPSGTRVVESFAFSECQALAEIEAPDGLEEIEYNAFEECPALKWVALPASVKKIDRDAFYDCSPDLTIVAEPDSYAARWARKNGFRVETREE